MEGDHPRLSDPGPVSGWDGQNKEGENGQIRPVHLRNGLARQHLPQRTLGPFILLLPFNDPNELNVPNDLNERNVLNGFNESNGLNDVYMKINRFEDLECWQEARKLTNMTYGTVKSSRAFQADYRLRDQTTGAAISVMNNISEGWASQSNPEFIKFLTYSRRSCAEVQNCFYVALDQKYIDENIFQEIYNQAKKAMMIIDGLLRYLRSQRSKRTKRS